MRAGLVWVLGVGMLGQTVEVPTAGIVPRQPPSAPLGDWTAAAGRTRVTLERDGVTLRGWSYVAPKAGMPTVLFFNGNGMAIDPADGLYRLIAAAGAGVTVFDYRGYGFSTGSADAMGMRQDSLAEYDMVAKSAGGPVVVYGFSLGTAMATYVASQREVKGLILAGTIASASEEMPVYLRRAANSLTYTADMTELLDSVGRIAKSRAPLLMLHGEADVLVPIGQGRAVFAASPVKAKKFVGLPGVGHNGTASAEDGVAAVGTFLKGLR